MYERHELSKKQQLRNLIGIIGGGILTACLISSYLLYMYNPSGQYIVKNALVNPQVATTLSYTEQEASSKDKPIRFVFNKIELSFYDSAKKQWQRQILTEAQYKTIYQSLEDDVSFLPNPEAESLFNQQNLSSLIVYVKNDNSSQTKPFQQVQFLPQNDLYRIELRDSKSSNQWAYFKHSSLDKVLSTALASSL